MKRPDLVKCTAIVVGGAIAIVGMIVDPSNSILAIGLFGMIAFVLSM